MWCKQNLGTPHGIAYIYRGNPVYETQPGAVNGGTVMCAEPCEMLLEKL